MKRLLYFLLFLLILSNCKDNKVDKNEILTQIIGKWHSIEMEEIVQDEKKWQPIPAATQVDVSFSFDGEMLNSDREPGCCPPSALIINGTLFNIKLTATNAYPCLAVRCGKTPPLIVEINENIMIISNGQRVKYTKY